MRFTGSSQQNDAQSRTAIAAFLDALLERHGAEIRAPGGSMRWMTFPVREALVAGIWVVVAKFAERYAWPLETPEQALTALAKVERYLTLSLILWYPITRDAVRIFEAQVLRATTARLGHAPAGTAVLALECWQLAVAQFFADLAKRTSRHLAELKELAERIETRNMVARGTAKLLHDDEVFDSARLTPEFIFTLYDVERVRKEHPLDMERTLGDRAILPEGMDTAVAPEWYIAHVQQLPRKLRRAERLRRALALLPYRLRNVPNDAHTNVQISIEETWVNTQLLLAALDAPDAEHVDASVVAHATAVVRELDSAMLIERFFTRMCARGATIPSAARRTLERFLQYRVASLAQWGDVLDDHQLGAAFIRVDAVAVDAITPDDAREIACGYAIAIVERASARGDDAYDAFVRTVTERIPWERCVVGDIEQMLVAHIVSAAAVADAVPRMPEDIRSRVLELLRIEALERPKLQEHLHAIGLVQRTVDESIADMDQLTDAQAEEFLLRIITHAEDRVVEDLLDPAKCIACALRLPPDAFRAVFDAREHREHIVILIFDRLTTERTKWITGVPRRDLRMFRERLGEDAWVRFTLAAVLRQRVYDMEDYASNPDEFVVLLRDEGQHALPWWAELRYHRRVRQLLGQTPEALTRALRAYPEDAMYRWLFGANDAQVATFIAQRDAYHARMEAEGLMPKPKRMKRAIRQTKHRSCVRTPSKQRTRTPACT